MADPDRIGPPQPSDAATLAQISSQQGQMSSQPNQGEPAPGLAPPPRKVAFRCKKCGRLHEAEHAGTRTLPTACQVCGGGVSFNTSGGKSYHADNWEILTEAPPERLQELGLSPEQVVGHQPNREAVVSENLKRAQEAADALRRKKARWEQEKDALVREAHAKQDELEALEAQTEELASGNDHSALAQHEDQKSALRQHVAGLLATEWLPRDEEHLAEVQKCIDRQGNHPVAGRLLKAGGRESAFTRDR